VGQESGREVFRSVIENCEWAFAGVYGPNNDGARSRL
jgi:hypothetical protein